MMFLSELIEKLQEIQVRGKAQRVVLQVLGEETSMGSEISDVSTTFEDAATQIVIISNRI